MGDDKRIGLTEKMAKAESPIAVFRSGTSRSDDGRADHFTQLDKHLLIYIESLNY